jgi:hypothetical protein
MKPSSSFPCLLATFPWANKLVLLWMNVALPPFFFVYFCPFQTFYLDHPIHYHSSQLAVSPLAL